MKYHLKFMLTLLIMVSVQFVYSDEFRIEFQWHPDMGDCKDSKHSPKIQLINVPEGTTKLSVMMKDEDHPYKHGGGKVKYYGEASIAAGTLKYWQGPCPNEQHTYTFIVKAKGGKKAKAKYSQKYPQ